MNVIKPCYINKHTLIWPEYGDEKIFFWNRIVNKSIFGYDKSKPWEIYDLSKFETCIITVNVNSFPFEVLCNCICSCKNFTMLYSVSYTDSQIEFIQKCMRHTKNNIYIPWLDPFEILSDFLF